MTDLFTKFVVAVPLKGIIVQCVASELVNHWVLRFGVPDVLHTDQGSNFNSELMKQVRQLLQINKSETTAYHPQGNGQVERFSRVITDTISKYCAENPRTWYLVLPYVNFAYNTTVHKTTRARPFRLVYGEECQYGIDLFNPKPIDYEYTEAGDFATWLHETFREAHAQAALCWELRSEGERTCTTKKCMENSISLVRKYGFSHHTKLNPENVFSRGKKGCSLWATESRRWTTRSGKHPNLPCGSSSTTTSWSPTRQNRPRPVSWPGPDHKLTKYLATTKLGAMRWPNWTLQH